ncbi:kinase-like protein [Lasiosphaeria ovina]|uniref:Kinase-like protein n=1 Tax=Lasiosphaeria ovina TaxID=92902 RepID=A0AAE0NJD1_9PEZI|nr:kinase-like protein [Lasiosphaeria ovina]
MSQLSSIHSRTSSTHSTHLAHSASSNSADREKKAEPVPAAPLTFPTTGFPKLDPLEKWEEETLPMYDPKEYYPARLGQVITHDKDQYQLIAKLGFGSSSTVWLCYNLCTNQYKALKIHINTLPFNRELEIFAVLNGKSKQKDHAGWAHLRRLDASFDIPGAQPGTTHSVLVFEPLGLSLRKFQELMPDEILDHELVQIALYDALRGLRYLHEVAEVTHADFHSDNLLMEVTDQSIFRNIAKEETGTNPSARKGKNPVIYLSRAIMSGAGNVILCDFGVARKGKEHQGEAVPLPYRAPEVILGMKWGYAVDIWASALTAWDLVQPTSLFKLYNEKDMELNAAHHLADMVALLGPPPKDFLQKSRACEKYWDKEGKWHHATVKVPTGRTMESLQSVLKGNDAVLFLNFIRKVLCWLPEQRPSAADLLKIPWVQAGKLV